jgi:hypothetical protein
VLVVVVMAEEVTLRHSQVVGMVIKASVEMMVEMTWRMLIPAVSSPRSNYKTQWAS